MFKLGMKVIRVSTASIDTSPIGTIGTIVGYYGEGHRMDVKIDFMPTRSSIWRIGDTAWTQQHHWKPYSRITKTKEL